MESLMLTQLRPDKTDERNSLIALLPKRADIGIPGVRVVCAQEREGLVTVARGVDYDVGLDLECFDMLGLL